MAKPNQPKEVKPKAEEAGAKAPIDGNMKLIVINLATTVFICILFLCITYVMLSSLLSSKLPTTADTQTTASDSADDNSDAVQKGIILDLGDFILNLSDTSPRKYLKANVALEVTKAANDPDQAAASGGEGGKEGASKEGGGEGGKDGAAASPVAAEMEQYKPAIRDAVITTLSSKTAAELSTVAGKELAKEQITESVNGIFSGERQVIRVSFGQFIIQ